MEKENFTLKEIYIMKNMDISLTKFDGVDF